MNEDGILLIDKPAGLSSAQVVGAVKRHFRFNKVGHGGTLDPGATGLLALLIGKGTSLSAAVMGGDKVYTGEILVGTETTTQDTEGEIVAELPYDLVTEERLLASGTTLASCGIAYAMRYIRAATEGGVEIGFKAHDAQQIVQQTVKGAVALLQATGHHPEEEIDKVTTPGGVTIKGLNAMEHAGFTSAVIRGLKAGMGQ